MYERAEMPVNNNIKPTNMRPFYSLTFAIFFLLGAFVYGKEYPSDASNAQYHLYHGRWPWLWQFGELCQKLIRTPHL